ncbi:DUF1349 domain-containing protein [Microbacterium sp. BK668]|uniref:DUF1349 domain-containing protein n=1 Tax=Microbacterium sp. BK668 TaxID=2512118 RepID=UPI0010607AD2|nr:DUF1349 domain-containing protein [Microbacterium sp. BK668]TDN90748.1 hypothetical protein EV279_0236 [Microbacterium sp. BK668]
MTQTYSLPSLPFALHGSEEWEWRIAANVVEVAAKPHSDLFVEPSDSDSVGAGTQLNAVTLTGTPPEGDFQLSARVDVDFRSTFDAGALVVWIDHSRWAKLCLEYAPGGEPMVVSVVTRDVSDDANGFALDEASVWLRVARVGEVFAFHASVDGARWRFVRAFVLEGEPVAVGFEAQSPLGSGCRVSFRDIDFASETLADLRDGS